SMSFSIGKETVGTDYMRTRWISVGTSPVPLSDDTAAKATKGILLIPISDEIMGTSDIYDGKFFVGTSPSVTPITDPADADAMLTAGVAVLPGQCFTFPAADPSQVWVVSTKTDQLLAYCIL